MLNRAILYINACMSVMFTKKYNDCSCMTVSSTVFSKQLHECYMLWENFYRHLSRFHYAFIAVYTCILCVHNCITDSEVACEIVVSYIPMPCRHMHSGERTALVRG